MQRAGNVVALRTSRNPLERYKVVIFRSKLAQEFVSGFVSGFVTTWLGRARSSRRIVRLSAIVVWSAILLGSVRSLLRLISNVSTIEFDGTIEFEQSVDQSGRPSFCHACSDALEGHGGVPVGHQPPRYPSWSRLFSQKKKLWRVEDLARCLPRCSGGPVSTGARSIAGALSHINISANGTLCMLAVGLYLPYHDRRKPAEKRQGSYFPSCCCCCCWCFEPSQVGRICPFFQKDAPPSPDNAS